VSTGRSGVVRRESFDPEWPKSIGIQPRNANFGVKNGNFEVNKRLVTYFAIFNGSFDATKPSHRRTKAARMTQEVIRIQASTSWLTTNTVVKVSFLAVSVDLRALPGGQNGVSAAQNLNRDHWFHSGHFGTSQGPGNFLAIPRCLGSPVRSFKGVNAAFESTKKVIRSY